MVKSLFKNIKTTEYTEGQKQYLEKIKKQEVNKTIKKTTRRIKRNLTKEEIEFLTLNCLRSLNFVSENHPNFNNL